jgi:RNA polymerase sigma-70 factor (ECF subfamily)
MWPDSQLTQELLAAARTGNADAVEALMGRHRDSLRRLVGLRLDPALARRVDASDIVQDVLMEANRRLQEYLKNPRLPFHLWLRHLARDQMIDAHRRHRLAQRRSLDREQATQGGLPTDDSAADLIAQLLDAEKTPASAALQQELHRRLTEALQQLNEDDRDIIMMRHHEQLSNQDVAAALELSEAAASMRYLRALRRLRKVLMNDPSAED